MSPKMSRKKIIQLALALVVFIVISVTGKGINNKENVREPSRETIATSTAIVGVTENMKPRKKEWGYRVVSVVDGDTIKVDMDGATTTIRLIGIDTPEVVDPRKPVQCFGREASAKAKELLQGKRVVLVSDETQGDIDKYKRLLRYVIMEDGLLFNEYMIEEGYAHEYTYQVPYVHQQRFKDAERYARENKKGLWADGVCETNRRPTTNNL